MEKQKTIGELLDEARRRSGAKQYAGHDIYDLMRFADETRHMIVFDVLTHHARAGNKGERTRLFLSDVGYDRAREDEHAGNIKILTHARVNKGDLHYDRKEQIR